LILTYFNSDRFSEDPLEKGFLNSESDEDFEEVMRKKIMTDYYKSYHPENRAKQSK